MSMYQDENIYSIEYQENDALMILKLEREDRSRHKLVFSQAVYWLLSPFEGQNIIFGFEARKPEELSGFDKENFTIDPQMYAYAAEHHFNIYLIDPSVGMGGYIMAAGMEDTDDEYFMD